MPSEPGYAEWASRHGPAESVACVWVSRPSETTGSRVLPDACLDIIWDGTWLFVAGPDTGPVEVARQPGLTVAGVRFRPGKAPGFLGVPASDLLDERIALAELWGHACADRLAARLARAPSPEAAADLLDRAVAGRAGSADAADPVVDALVAMLAGQPESNGVVQAASRALAVGERRLHRRCCAAVGYGPKMLERVLRFQRARSLARRGGSLALLAVEAGYADQAHLTRECQRLAGTTPSDLFKTSAEDSF